MERANDVGNNVASIAIARNTDEVEENVVICSAQTIRKLRLLDPCVESHKDAQGNSAGLSACGYDLTASDDIEIAPGTFLLASAAERFDLPPNVAAIIHDKSTFARRGMAVQNTVAEPGWRGYLTLEITNHGHKIIRIRKGCAIAQAIFHLLDEPTQQPYAGKYQDQGREPVPARDYTRTAADRMDPEGGIPGRNL